jgi:hypothetical protein
MRNPMQPMQPQPQPWPMAPYGLRHPVQPARFLITLRKHTGMILIMRTQTLRVQGTLEQCEAAYRDAQMHNLLAGWWGLISMLVMNWVAIFGNMSAISDVRRLAASPPAPQFPR